MAFYYKVRAIKTFKKDENGNFTEEVREIRPVIPAGFAGAIDDAEEWFLVKVNAKIEEGENVVLILDENLELEVVNFGVTMEIMNLWTP